MVLSCAAYGCTTQYVKNSGISFHKFPDDPELKKKWIVFTKRKTFVPTVNSKLCSKHFSKDQFQSGSNCVLKTDAVPIISHFTPHFQISSPKKRWTVKHIQQTPSQKKEQTMFVRYSSTVLQSSNSILKNDPIEVSSSSSICEEDLPCELEEEDLPYEPEEEDLRYETEEEDLPCESEEEDLSYEYEEETLTRELEEDITCEPEEDRTCEPEEEDLTYESEEEDQTCEPGEEDLTFEPEEEDLTCEPEKEDLTFEPEEEDLTCELEEEDLPSELEEEDLLSEPMTSISHCSAEYKQNPELPKKKDLQRKVKILQQRLKRRDAKLESMKSIIHALKKKLKMVESQNRVAKSCNQTCKSLSNHNRHINTIQMKNSGEESKIKFLCDQCGKPFTLKTNLKRHIDAVHSPGSVRYARFVAELNMLPKPYKCGSCSATFKHIGSLKRHERISHKTGKPPREKNMNCPICNFNAYGTSSMKTIYGHFKSAHGIDVTEETLHFDSLEKFYEWKKDIENKTTSFFCKSYTKPPLLMYRCRRFGTYKQIQNNKASRRIIGFCPARMKVKILENQSVFVLYTANHVGHQNDLEHLRLRKERRGQIANEVLNKIPREKVLKGSKDTLTNCSKTKKIVKKLNKNDISIEKTFNINIKSTEHPFVPGNIGVWVQNLNMSKDTGSLADEEEIVEQPLIVEEVPYEDTDIKEIKFEELSHEGMPTSNQREDEKITDERKSKSKCLGTTEDIKWFRSYLR